MLPPVLVAGLDGRSLVLETSVLRRDGHAVEELGTGRDLLLRLPASGARLLVLGAQLPDLGLPEIIQRIRSNPATRAVSILVLTPSGAPEALDAEALSAGANAVLRRPLDAARLDAWVAKLLLVPRRVQARVPVQGHVVGTPRSAEAGHFLGLTRNLSVNGMLLASPVRLAGGNDVELELTLPRMPALTALARVVREAPEVSWPYLGYGVEFLYLPQESLDAIVSLVERDSVPAVLASPAAALPGIHSTLRRDNWVFEILSPIQLGGEWQVEIRRAPRDVWRPGRGGPFYVVSEATPEAALKAARAFLSRFV